MSETVDEIRYRANVPARARESIQERAGAIGARGRAAAGAPATRMSGLGAIALGLLGGLMWLLWRRRENGQGLPIPGGGGRSRAGRLADRARRQVPSVGGRARRALRR
jgi:LPXTG-motif cell wall-anchored protein